MSSSIASPGGSAAGETVPVEVIPLDELFSGRQVDYLKGDLEGFEMDVLKGGEELIHRCKPRVAFTTYHKRDHAEQITALLRRLHPGYKIKCKGASLHGGPLMLHAWT